MIKKKEAFICVRNSCRSQIAEAIGKHLASDVFESYSAGTETKSQINQDAVRLMKQIYGIEMEQKLNILALRLEYSQKQHSKLTEDISEPDIVISKGCRLVMTTRVMNTLWMTGMGICWMEVMQRTIGRNGLSL